MSAKDANPAAPGPSPASKGGKGEDETSPEKQKKVYDRVLLWMLDIKPLNKDMRISPLIEVRHNKCTLFFI